MCAIWAFIQLFNNNIILNYNKLYDDFLKLKNRGPTFSNYQIYNNTHIGFHRLAIMNPTISGNQPFVINDNNRTIVFICNGEIYNFKDIIKNYNIHDCDNSDCIVIPKLYIKLTSNGSSFNDFNKLFIESIKGEFAFILFEFNNLNNLNKIIIGRDSIGVRPLYYYPPTESSNYLAFSSEIKGLSYIKDNIIEFEPGTLLEININDINRIENIKKEYFVNVYESIHNLNTSIESEEYYLNLIRTAVINSVKRRLFSDCPIGFLLSGGVDSSLIAAISARILNQTINTYCCGMDNGTDLLYANKVAKHIKSNHSEVIFTENEGINIIDSIIYIIESWDVTTIRASVGQYIVSKYIQNNSNIKVVLVGEGPDEVCSSYLFNYYAPTGEDLHDTAIEYVKNIHMYDGRRADRCISNCGLEARIPFLDPEFISAYWSIPSEWRHPKYKGIEKWWLRKAFENTNLLPHEILWRKKEAFSDGVSSNKKSWYTIIQESIENESLDESLNESLDENIPSKEALYYKNKFIEYFGSERLNILPKYWQPKWISDKYVDPSARVLNIY
jgi:asparagine synthase (glutamine-hydrolysing)